MPSGINAEVINLLYKPTHPQYFHVLVLGHRHGTPNHPAPDLSLLLSYPNQLGKWPLKLDETQ